MKRIWIAAISLALVSVIFSGCKSHKSDAEQTDITTFRCEDYLYKVQNRLGETDLDTYGGGYYVKYEGLNLWGYEGSATFYVRDDKNTISRFACELELSGREYKDVVGQISEKFGEAVEKETASGDDTYFTWECDKDEYGYDEISISPD